MNEALRGQHRFHEDGRRDPGPAAVRRPGARHPAGHDGGGHRRGRAAQLVVRPGAGFRVGRPDRLGTAALVRFPAADRACATGSYGGPPVRADPRGHHDLRGRPAHRAPAGGAAVARPARFRDPHGALCRCGLAALPLVGVGRAPGPAPSASRHRPGRHLLAGDPAPPTTGQRLVVDQSRGGLHLQPVDAGASAGGRGLHPGRSADRGAGRAVLVRRWHHGQLRRAVLHRVPDAGQGLGPWPADRRHGGRTRCGSAAVLVAAGGRRPGPRRRPPGRGGGVDPVRPAPRRPRPRRRPTWPWRWPGHGAGPAMALARPWRWPGHGAGPATAQARPRRRPDHGPFPLCSAPL